MSKPTNINPQSWASAEEIEQGIRLARTNNLHIRNINRDISFPCPSSIAHLRAYVDWLLSVYPDHNEWIRNMISPDLNLVDVCSNLTITYSRFLCNVYSKEDIYTCLADCSVTQLQEFLGIDYWNYRYTETQYICFEFIVFYRQRHLESIAGRQSVHFTQTYLPVGFDVHKYLTTPIALGKCYADLPTSWLYYPLELFAMINTPPRYIKGLEYNPLNLIRDVDYLQLKSETSTESPVEIFPELSELADEKLFYIEGPISFYEVIVQNKFHILLMGDLHGSLDYKCDDEHPLVPKMTLHEVIDDFINSPSYGSSNLNNVTDVHVFLEWWYSDRFEYFVNDSYIQELVRSFPHCFQYNVHRRSIATSGLDSVQDVNDLLYWNSCVRKFTNNVKFHYVNYREEHMDVRSNDETTDDDTTTLVDVLLEILECKTLWKDIAFKFNYKLGERFENASKVYRALRGSPQKEFIIDFITKQLQLLQPYREEYGARLYMTKVWALYMDIGFLCRFERQLEYSQSCKVVVYAGDAHIKRYIDYISTRWPESDSNVLYSTKNTYDDDYKDRCILVKSSIRNHNNHHEVSPLHPKIKTVTDVYHLLTLDTISPDTLNELVAALVHQDPQTRILHVTKLTVKLMEGNSQNIVRLCKTNEAKLAILLAIELYNKSYEIHKTRKPNMSPKIKTSKNRIFKSPKRFQI